MQLTKTAVIIKIIIINKKVKKQTNEFDNEDMSELKSSDTLKLKLGDKILKDFIYLQGQMILGDINVNEEFIPIVKNCKFVLIIIYPHLILKMNVKKN